MKIQHGGKFYWLNINLIIPDGNGGYENVQYSNISEFTDSMLFEYPGLDFNQVINVYNDWLNKLNNYANTPGHGFKDEWNHINIYLAIVGSEVIVSMKCSILENKILEKQKTLDNLSDGLICKIDSRGWVVRSEKNRVDYYTDADGDDNIYPIYVYRDMIILSNANRDNPTILTGNYFIYNAGKKPSK